MPPFTVPLTAVLALLALAAPVRAAATAPLVPASHAASVPASIERIWSDALPRLRRERNVLGKPLIAASRSWNAAFRISPTQTIGLSVLFAAGVGCDMGASGRDAVAEPVRCPARVALLTNNDVDTVERVPGLVCVAGPMDADARATTTATLSDDRASILVVVAANGRELCRTTIRTPTLR